MAQRFAGTDPGQENTLSRTTPLSLLTSSGSSGWWIEQPTPVIGLAGEASRWGVGCSLARRSGRMSRSMDESASTPGEIAALRQALDLLDRRIEREAAVCATSVAELRRQHHAAPKRRGGPGSADARRYALGSTLALVGAGEVDDTALVGLLAHPVRMLAWMAEALERGAGPMFGDLVDAVLAAPGRRAWCQQWGRVLRWRQQKPRYDAAVASFIASGRTGPNEPWRRKDITDDQAALIAILADLMGESAPILALRGDAFDWIRDQGGNPTYWREPPLPPSPEDEHE